AIQSSAPGREAESSAPRDAGDALWRLVGNGIVELGWLLAVALAPLLLGMLWTVNCDPLGGFAYFVMGPVCTVVIGWTAGVGMTVLIGDRPRWQQLTAAFVPFCASTLV